jgi:HSP20 family protein
MERRPDFGSLLRRDAFSSPFFAANPFGLMRRFADQMESVLGGWGSDIGWESAGMWAPAIDVTEREGNLIVHADLPGLKKEDVKVETIDNQLVIQGERRQEHEEHDGGSWRSERRYGSFYRSIPLPDGAETERARAEFKDGVLQVSVPVPATRSRSRQVPIEGAAASERREAGSESTAQTRTSKAG